MRKAMLVVTAVLLGAVALGGLGCDASQRLDVAALAERKDWPRQRIHEFPSVDAYLSTRWMDRRLYYRLRLDGFSWTLARLTEGSLVMTFTTDDGQPVLEQLVPLRGLKVTLKVVGENPGGFVWERHEFVAPEKYGRASLVRFEFRPVLPTS